MSTYYQKHNQIDAYEFKGNIKQLIHLMPETLKMYITEDLKYGDTFFKVTYDKYRNIKWIDYNNSLDIEWQPEYKKIHQSYHKWKRNYDQIKHTHKYTFPRNKTPSYKYKFSHKRLCVGDYIVIKLVYEPYTYQKKKLWHNTYQMQIWHAKDFKANWSQTKINRKK